MQRTGPIAKLAVLLSSPFVLAAAPVEMTTEQAHAHMRAQLGVSELRPGADPNDPDAPNAVNYDESKANPWPLWPDALTLSDGTPVTGVAQWESQRRPELLDLFSREIYGYVPDDVPGVNWEVMSEEPGMAGDVPVTIINLAGRLDNSADPEIEVALDLTLVAPTGADNAPVIVELYFPGFPGRPAPAFPPDHVEQILDRGWAWATFVPTSAQADNGAGLTSGVIGLANHGQPRDPEDWGALRAWAWGASRALDYLDSDPRTDASRAAIAGLSRYGKAAAVAMAYDERWSTGFIGSSGAGGLKPHRRDYGERVENLAGAGQHHWMAGNYLKYAGPLGWDDLPVESHQLLALAAPRPVFISAGNPAVEGGWVDARGMFMTGVAAGPVYELYGKRGLATDIWPAVGEGLLDGDIAYRMHEGGHTLGPNWPFMLDFAAGYFEAN